MNILEQLGLKAKTPPRDPKEFLDAFIQWVANTKYYTCNFDTWGWDYFESLPIINMYATVEGRNFSNQLIDFHLKSRPPHGQVHNPSRGISQILKFIGPKKIYTAVNDADLYLLLVDAENKVEAKTKGEPDTNGIPAIKNSDSAKKLFINSILAQQVPAADGKDTKLATELEKNITTNTEKLTPITLALSQAQNIVRQAKVNKEKFTAQKFGSEFDALCQNPKIEKILVTDGQISIFTRHLYSQPLKNKYPGKKADFGCYRIDIPTSGDSSDIRLYNLTRTVNFQAVTVHHPHTMWDNQNRPCFGNIDEEMGKLMKTRQYDILIQIMIHFLEIINEEETDNTRIYCFPMING